MPRTEVASLPGIYSQGHRIFQYCLHSEGDLCGMFKLARFCANKSPVTQIDVAKARQIASASDLNNPERFMKGTRAERA